MSFDTSFIEIKARLSRWLYRSEDGSFCIGRYEVVNASEYTFITMVGQLPELHFPATYTGEWVNDARYGRQFRVEWVASQLPDNTKDMEEFVCSMRVGIGKKRVRKMLALVGKERFWDTLNNEPEVFLKVSGITEVMLCKLQSSINAMSYQRDLLQFFKGDLKMNGSRYKRLTTLYKGRLDEMLPDIRNNPYVLQEIGIPFKEIDHFCAHNSLLAINDNRRLTAATIQVLLDAQGNSHVGVPANIMARQVRAMLSHEGSISLAECQMFLDALIESRFVTKANDMYYLTRAYNEEKYVAETIQKRLSAASRELSWDKVNQALYEYGKNRKDENGDPAPIVLAESQKQAVYMALTHHFCIITGGPGTGKSMILGAILYCWKKFFKDDDWLLMAPTGKAAVRMTQATCQPAGTIHSALGLGVSEMPLDPDAPSFHPADITKGLVIVDETSMIDLSVTTALLKAVNLPNQHLVFVGDPDQLPSVGYGNVLSDLIRSKAVPVTMLTTIYRQAAGNPIIVNSKKMRDGDINLDWSHNFFKGYNQGSDEKNMEAACKFFMRCVNQYGIKNVAMLSPYHSATDVCTNKLNERLQDAFNPDKGRGSIKLKERTLRFGDRVMQLKNTETVVNGDVGTIQAVYENADMDEPCLVVKFDNSNLIKEYTRDELPQLELAYAISVHKSQGSQYKCIVMMLPIECRPFLRRDLVYTGTTRASKYVAFFGPLRTLQYAIQNKEKEPRHTALATLLEHNYSYGFERIPT